MAESAKVIEFNPKKVENKCSFCKTPESATKKLISNTQGKFICDKCVTKCKGLIEDDVVA